MKLKDNLAKILIPILSILIAFIAGGIIILCLGKNPVEAYGYLFSGAFGSGRKMGQTLVIACPLIFTGLAAAFAYKCGVFNLGGEGQFIMGAVTSIFVSAKLGDAGMGGLLVSLARQHARFIHRIQDAAVNRFQAIPDIRQCARHDDGHRIVDVGIFHLRLKGRRDDFTFFPILHKNSFALLRHLKKMP